MPRDVAFTLSPLSNPKPLLPGSSPMPDESGGFDRCSSPRKLLHRRIPLRDITHLVNEFERWREEQSGTLIPPLDILRVWSWKHGESLSYIVDLVTRLSRTSLPTEEEVREPEPLVNNSVEKVKKDHVERLRGKKSERDRKIRTLMSMR